VDRGTFCGKYRDGWSMWSPIQDTNERIGYFGYFEGEEEALNPGIVENAGGKCEIYGANSCLNTAHFIK